MTLPHIEILGFDLTNALTPDVNPVEIIVRGVVMYLAVFLLLRTLLRGRTGGTTTTDLLVLVLIADAAQNAMSANYGSIADGILLVATIVGTSFTLNWLGFRFAAVERLVHPKRQPLVVNGRVMRKQLAEELMTEDELMTQLRLQGVDDVSEVKVAYLEGTGEVSVIKLDGEANANGKKRRVV